MTANQIALLGALEDKRHNEATEGEVNRHNAEVEALTAESNRITEERNKMQTDYEKERNRIQDEYNKAYLEWQKSFGEQKLNLEGQMNAIKEQEVNNQKEYNTLIADIKRRETDLTEKRITEEVRHNQEMEQFEGMRIENQKWFWDKSLDYQNRALEEQSSYHSLSLAREDLSRMSRETLAREQMAISKQGNDISAASTLLNYSLNMRKLGLTGGIQIFNAGLDSLKFAYQLGTALK